MLFRCNPAVACWGKDAHTDCQLVLGPASVIFLSYRHDRIMTLNG